MTLYMGTPGLFTGLCDRDGEPIQIGDTLEFVGLDRPRLILAFEYGRLVGFNIYDVKTPITIIFLELEDLRTASVVKKWNEHDTY